jgi:hypothetical protein
MGNYLKMKIKTRYRGLQTLQNRLIYAVLWPFIGLDGFRSACSAHGICYSFPPFSKNSPALDRATPTARHLIPDRQQTRGGCLQIGWLCLMHPRLANSRYHVRGCHAVSAGSCPEIRTAPAGSSTHHIGLSGVSVWLADGMRGVGSICVLGGLPIGCRQHPAALKRRGSDSKSHSNRDRPCSNGPPYKGTRQGIYTVQREWG